MSRACTTTTSRSCAHSLPTIDIDALRRDGWVRVPYPDDGRPWANGGFPTTSGKVELASDTLEQMGQPRLPTFVAPSEGPTGVPAQRYPLQLMTPKHHSRFLNSGYSHLPKHGPAEGGPFLELDDVRRNSPRTRGGRLRPCVERPGERRGSRARSHRGCGRGSPPFLGVGGCSIIPTARSPTRSRTTRSPSGAAASRTATRWSRSKHAHSPA